jgi:hypothetical protein
MRTRTVPTLIDLTAHDRTQPVQLPRRGPLELVYTSTDGRRRHWPRVSVGLAAIVLREAGYAVAEPA